MPVSSADVDWIGLLTIRLTKRAPTEIRPFLYCVKFILIFALETAGKLLTLETDAYVHQREGPAGLDQIRATFTSQVAAVRNLLRVGARESTYFRARIANYNAFVVSLVDLFQSAVDLEHRRQNELPILNRMRDEIEA